MRWHFSKNKIIPIIDRYDILNFENCKEYLK